MMITLILFLFASCCCYYDLNSNKAWLRVCVFTENVVGERERERE